MELSLPLAPRLTRAFVDSRAEVFRRIRSDGCDLAVWTRDLPDWVASACDALAKGGLRALDVTAAPGAALREALAPLAGLGAAGSWLCDDIAARAMDLADAADCGRVRVRLAVVRDAACAAFHVDTLRVRLLCTYHGEGMQWADEPDVNRSELGLRGRSIAETNAAIVPEPSQIRTVPAGAVAIFKGLLWPGNEGCGLVHRSAPSCCGEHPRLRLVIDPMDAGA
jgi:hypothetical protein